MSVEPAEDVTDAPCREGDGVLLDSCRITRDAFAATTLRFGRRTSNLNRVSGLPLRTAYDILVPGCDRSACVQ